MPKKALVQWGWAEMEELLQCPVCLDIPGKGVVEQCRHGHHICASCKKQVDSCPLCKCDFHGTRNFVIEELIRHFEVLKNTMLLNSIVNEAKAKKKAKTKLNASANVFIPTPTIRKVTTPNSTKGNYPCRVIDCNTSFPAARLLNHIRCCHPDFLTETVVDFTDNYHQTWEITFKNKKAINLNTFVIFVRGIGLIFLTIEILRSGQLIAAVQMAVKFRQAQNFLACLEFLGNDVVHSYNSRLVSVREGIPAVLNKKLCFTLTKNELKSVCLNKKFKCRMSLSRYNELDSNLLTPPNVEQINTISALRASLIHEENDKKLLKELEVGSTQTVSTNRLNGPSQSISESQENSMFEQQLHKLENAWKILTDTIQNKNGTPNSTGSTSREPDTTTTVPPNGLRAEPIAGRRRNRNRRNRGGLNGARPEN